MFRIEMNRLFKSRGLYISLLIGCGLALWHFFRWIAPVSRSWDMLNAYGKSTGFTLESAYEVWMHSSFFPTPSFLFLMVLPILAVLPYGLTYDNDRKSGWIKNIYVRAERKRYMKVKLGLAFLSGMLVIMLPLLFNFMLAAASLPLKAPQPCLALMRPRNIWCGLFYQNPMCYVALVTLLNGVYGGLMSMLAVLLSHSTDYGFLVGILPFLYHMFLFSLFNLAHYADYAPAHFLSGGVLLNYYAEYVIMGIVTVAIALIAYRKGTISDVY